MDGASVLGQSWEWLLVLTLALAHMIFKSFINIFNDEDDDDDNDDDCGNGGAWALALTLALMLAYVQVYAPPITS